MLRELNENVQEKCEAGAGVGRERGPLLYNPGPGCKLDKKRQQTAVFYSVQSYLTIPADVIGEFFRSHQARLYSQDTPLLGSSCIATPSRALRGFPAPAFHRVWISRFGGGRSWGLCSKRFQNPSQVPASQPSRFVPREKASCRGVPLRANDLSRLTLSGGVSE